MIGRLTAFALPVLLAATGCSQTDSEELQQLDAHYDAWVASGTADYPYKVTLTTNGVVDTSASVDDVFGLLYTAYANGDSVKAEFDVLLDYPSHGTIWNDNQTLAFDTTVPVGGPGIVTDPLIPTPNPSFPSPGDSVVNPDPAPFARPALINNTNLPVNPNPRNLLQPSLNPVGGLEATTQPRQVFPDRKTSTNGGLLE